MVSGGSALVFASLVAGSGVISPVLAAVLGKYHIVQSATGLI